jgi:hypothetical protein
MCIDIFYCAKLRLSFIGLPKRPLSYNFKSFTGEFFQQLNSPDLSFRATFQCTGRCREHFCKHFSALKYSEIQSKFQETMKNSYSYGLDSGLQLLYDCEPQKRIEYHLATRIFLFLAIQSKLLFLRIK